MTVPDLQKVLSEWLLLLFHLFLLIQSTVTVLKDVHFLKNADEVIYVQLLMLYIIPACTRLFPRVWGGEYNSGTTDVKWFIWRLSAHP